MTFDPAHRQPAAQIRMEWGPTGATAIAADADIAVVVDVLSFTTTLTVAVGRGMTVFPYRWKDDGAVEYAAARDAVLALPRFEAAGQTGRLTLSPASLDQVSDAKRLVLPSPNGSTISFLLAESGARVVGACLRNAPAVAAWLRPYVDDGARVAVVPAGERWPDGSLRPAVEDLWGAGAVIAALLGSSAAVEASTTGQRTQLLSPEARVAAAAFRAVEPLLAAELAGCAGGVELSSGGFGDDVRIAGEYAASEAVPVLDGDAFGGV